MLDSDEDPRYNTISKLSNFTILTIDDDSMEGEFKLHLIACVGDIACLVYPNLISQLLNASKLRLIQKFSTFD